MKGKSTFLKSIIHWLGGNALPVTVPIFPGLYLLVAGGENKRSILLCNIHLDPIQNLSIELNGTYILDRCLNGQILKKVIT